MGTPQFAVPTLKVLLDNGYDIVGVITSTDKLGGRGRKQLIESDVKKYAVSQGLHVMQPPNLKNPEFVARLKALQADLQIVVAFRMLPEVVWNMPRLGTYNLHGSLLPKYRGAAPINWAIIRGEEFTGVTTFKLKHEIDTGSIAYQKKVSIGRGENVSDIHDRMMEVGAGTILKTVQDIENESIKLYPQDESGVTKAPKIFHKSCQIDTAQNPFEVHNFIRGLSPYPTAWTMIGNLKLKIFRSSYSYQKHHKTVGAFLSNGKSTLRLMVSEGFIDLLEVQLEGRRKMATKDLINGLKLEEFPIEINN